MQSIDPLTRYKLCGGRFTTYLMTWMKISAEIIRQWVLSQFGLGREISEPHQWQDWKFKAGHEVLILSGQLGDRRATSYLKSNSPIIVQTIRVMTSFADSNLCGTFANFHNERNEITSEGQESLDILNNKKGVNKEAYLDQSHWHQLCPLSIKKIRQSFTPSLISRHRRFSCQRLYLLNPDIP